MEGGVTRANRELVRGSYAGPREDRGQRNWGHQERSQGSGGHKGIGRLLGEAMGNGGELLRKTGSQ